MTITSPIIIAVPIDEYDNCSKTDIGTDDKISGEDPWGNNRFITIKLILT